MKKMGSMFAFEGGDGVGKATQTKLLVERLTGRGQKAAQYSFPRYDTPVGRLIEGMLKGSVVVGGTGEGNGDASGFNPLIFQSLMLADKRMYQAKTSGKARCVMGDGEVMV